MLSPDAEINVIGLQCPQLLLKTKQALAQMHSGQILHIVANDPSAKIDFAVFADRSHNELLDSREENGIFHFMLRKV